MSIIQIRAILPKKAMNSAVFRKEFRAAMETVVDEIQDRFEATAETWVHEVVFKREIKDTARLLSGKVSTKDEIYRYVNNGTRPHIIRPKRASRLAFRSGYFAKTFPGKLYSVRGGTEGDDVYASAVRHPGTEARDFDEAIYDEIEPILYEEIDLAMERAAKSIW